MSKLHVELPDEDHRQLKATAALEGLTIMEAVAEAIRMWLRERTTLKK